MTAEGKFKAGRYPYPSEIRNDNGWIAAHVVARRKVAAEVVEIVLTADAGALPDWTPGAHAEIELLSSLTATIR